jgi:hypothetical protein
MKLTEPDRDEFLQELPRERRDQFQHPDHEIRTLIE